MTRSLRLIGALLAVMAALVLVPGSASAHALVQSSDPAAGSVVQSSPATVTLTFNESADAALSRISVLDTSGRDHTTAHATAVAGHPLQLSVAVAPLPRGVYTVDWRSVSIVDGHSAGGSFAFGFGVTPPTTTTTTSAATTETSSLTPLAGVARALLYTGLFLLAGCLVIGLLDVGDVVVTVRRAAWIATLVAVAGALGVTEAQREDAGASLSDVTHTSLGIALLWRTLPLLATLLVLTLGRWRQRRLAVIACVLTAIAMLGDVVSGHANAEDIVAFNVAAQWLHIAAAAIWIGGLAALLLAMRQREATEQSRLARHYSTTAGFCLLIVATTGVWRAWVEIGSWSRLFSTTFGWLVVVKSALIILLALLGATNRWVNIRSGSEGLARLRRIARGEVVIGLVAAVLAAALVNVAPPTTAVAASAPLQIVASGSDPATTLRATLSATPGTAGFNTFAMTLTDYDSGAPVTDATVRLTFHALNGQAGDSTLTLSHGSSNAYTATGSNLSLDGTWRVSALVTRGATAEVITLQLTPRTTSTITVAHDPGLPALYTIHLDSGRSLQVYLDPDRVGSGEFHTTFFTSAGTEEAITSIAVTATPPTGATVTLTPRLLEPGHYVSDVTAVAGATHYDISATTNDGTVVVAAIDLTPGG